MFPSGGRTKLGIPQIGEVELDQRLAGGETAEKGLREETPTDVYQTTTQTYLSENMHWIVAAFGESAWPKLIE